MDQSPSQAHGSRGGYPVPAVEAHRRMKQSVYNPFIWVVLAVPAVGALLQLYMVPVTRYMYAGHIVTVSPLSLLTPAYFLLSGAGFFLYAATVVLAYLDWRRLGQVGIIRPFHWAWGFLPAVYIIGRTVTIRKAVPGRTLWPVFYLIAVLLTSVALSVIKASSVPPWLGHAGL